MLAPAEARTVPTFMVVGGADATAAVVHCVDRVLAVEGVRWASSGCGSRRRSWSARSLGRHALVACTDATDEHALLATIDEVRAILADHDLSAVPTQDDPSAASAATVDETADEVLVSAAPTPPPLVGARFAGAGAREPRRGRRRFGRGTLSPSPGETPRTSTRG